MCVCNVLKLQLTKNLLLNYFLRKKVGQVSPRSPGPPEPGMHRASHSKSPSQPMCGSPIAKPSPLLHLPGQNLLFLPFLKTVLPRLSPETARRRHQGLHSSAAFKSPSLKKKSARWICHFPLSLAGHVLLPGIFSQLGIHCLPLLLFANASVTCSRGSKFEFPPYGSTGRQQGEALKNPAVPPQTYLQTREVLQLPSSCSQPHATVPLGKEKTFCKQKKGTRNYMNLGEMEIQD